MSLFCANLFSKHLVTATKHRYTRGFGHIRKRAHRARETMIFAGFAHRARDLLVFNIKMCFSVRASFRGGTIYIYICMSLPIYEEHFRLTLDFAATPTVPRLVFFLYRFCRDLHSKLHFHIGLVSVLYRSAQMTSFSLRLSLPSTSRKQKSIELQN
jgi:hypothetical protein